MIFAKNKDGGGGACSPEHDCLAPAENDAPRLVEPKDGGYGWVVVFASFMCMVIVDGVSYSYSVFNIRIKDYFNVGYTTSTWIGSLLIGCYLLVGPFVSMLANRYGCRRITIVGACISCTAFIFAVFSPNIEVLIITFGILGGIGFGLIYLPAIVIVGHWFERKRAFATGITVCGSGIGSFIFPPLSRYLLDEYDWRGAVAILAGLVLNCAVLGALFRPLEPPKTRRMKRGIVHPGLIMKALIEEKKRQRTISNGSLDNCIITKDNRIIKIDTISIRSRNGLYPARIKDNCKLSSKSLNKSKNSLVLIDNGTIMCTNSGAVYKPVVRGRSSSQRLTAIPPHMRSVMKPPIQVSSTSAVSEDVNADCNVPKAQSYDTIPLTQQWESLTEVPVNSCKKSLSCNSVEHLKDNPKTLSTSFVNMPVSTFDSAYSSNVKLGGSQANRNGLVGGSMMSEPQFSASIQSLEYLYEDDSSCLSSTMQVLRKILDLSLLKSPMFALLCFLSTMSMLGFFVPFVYMQVFAESAVHVEKKDSAFLLSIIGIANTVGRVLSGWVADRPWANSLVLNNMALILAGILTILLPFCNSYALLACFAAGFGICIAAFVSLRSILLVDLLGLEKLTNSFGLLILFQGVATMGGSPLAGAVMETSGSTDYAFYMAGVFLLLSGALGAPLRRIKQWEEGSKAPSLPHNTTVHETVHLESVETAI